MSNTVYNKVTFNNQTLIDLSQDTVTSAAHIMSGYVGHLADGSQVTGTGQGGGTAAISVVDTTDTAGGTIRTITALNISDTTAVAADVAQGKYFYTAQGVKTAGTASGGTPPQTQHSIYFEFSDSTDTTITGYWNDSFISNAITATTPTTYGQKTVTSAQLDGVEWYSYSPSDIPLNTQLIDYSAVTNGYGIYSDGSVSETEWMGVSDYTRIDPTMTFTFIGNQWYYLAFYDMSKTFISTLYIYDVTSGTGTGTLSPSNIPSNASWVRITSSQNPNNSELSLIRTA